MKLFGEFFAIATSQFQYSKISFEFTFEIVKLTQQQKKQQSERTNETDRQLRYRR